ncbi:MAG: response regulator [Burkholderiales bacterium]|nr:response regulator [Burkholderiales bacterium]
MKPVVPAEPTRPAEPAGQVALATAELQRRLDLLAEAGAALARSLDPEDTLQAIARTVVPAIADWCRIDLLDDAGVLQRRLAYHSNPVVSQLAIDMARRMHASPDAVGSMGWCIRNGRSHHGRFELSDDPALREYTQTFGMKEHFILPLVARGRTIGAMGVLQAESGRSLPEADRALVQELAHRAALAIDNARLYAEASAARQQAEAASRAKDEFLAILGHELRNPLAPIVTALELMARRDPKVHEEERRIVARQVAHLSRLIDDLLDVSRITRGKVELQRVPLDLKAMVMNALEQTQPAFERRAHPVRLELQPGPVVVEGDPVRLTQVICNLLANAAKFTPADRHVTVELHAVPGWVELAVRDEGPGIAPELLPRVFDAFVQGGQALDRQAGGLGLGLAIVRLLVELHGGTVEAQSPGEGQGSRFLVRLPGTDQEARDTGPRLPSQETPDGANGRLLVVDDNVDAAETLAELLRMVGYEVRCAVDGPSALAVLQGYDAQLALLDIGLPQMDGYELAARIRARPGGEAIKLVALTGYGTESDRARALGARFDEHLVKPVDAVRLMELLETMLA